MASLVVFIFSILGNIASACVYLSPVPTFLFIYRKKTTQGHDVSPYTVALFSSILWLYYGCSRSNATVISSNAFGFITEALYVYMYFYYATKAERMLAGKLLCFLICLDVVVFAATFPVIHSRMQASVVEWICVMSTTLTFGAPLISTYQVYKDKSVEHMPIVLSCFLTLSGAVWCAYGLLGKDYLVAIPNGIGFVLGAFQIVVYMVFRTSELPS